jgi:hypothetical protein
MTQLAHAVLALGTVQAADEIVVGTDPTGTAKLRIGGGLRVNGASSLTGHVTFTADDTYDLGALAATRPRTGYFGTALVVGTDPGGTASIRAANGILINGPGGGNNSEVRVRYPSAITGQRILYKIVPEAGSDGSNFFSVGSFGHEAIGDWTSSGDRQTWAFIQAVPVGSTTVTTIAHFVREKWEAASDNVCDLGEITTPRKFKTGYFGTSVQVRHATNQATGVLLVGYVTGANTPRLMWENTVDWPGAGTSIRQTGSNQLDFATDATAGAGSGTARWAYNAATIFPATDNAMDIGSTSKRWKTVYGYTGDFTTAVLGGMVRATADTGGTASTNSLSGTSDITANSTGVGTILFKGATSRNSAGFVKIYVGTTAYYVPVFLTITG